MKRPNNKPLNLGVSADKLAMIRSGERRKSLTGFKENKKVTSNEKGKFELIQKEKKFEEVGVTRKKQNFIMFESILGTKREIDLNKIEGARKNFNPKGRQEDIIITQKKRKEYLDNYQYHESKVFGKNPIETVVVHKRWGGPVGGIFEEETVQKTTNVRSSSANASRRGNMPNLKGKPRSPEPTKKIMTTTTKVVRKTVGGEQPTYQTSTSRTVTKGGKTQTTTRTSTGRGRK